MAKFYTIGDSNRNQKSVNSKVIFEKVKEQYRLTDEETEEFIKTAGE